MTGAGVLLGLSFKAGSRDRSDEGTSGSQSKAARERLEDGGGELLVRYPATRSVSSPAQVLRDSHRLVNVALVLHRQGGCRFPLIDHSMARPMKVSDAV